MEYLFNFLKFTAYTFAITILILCFFADIIHDYNKIHVDKEAYESKKDYEK